MKLSWCCFFAAVIGFVVTGCSDRTSGGIAQARARENSALLVREKGREFGLICLAREEECVALIKRAEANPRLKEVFMMAKTAEVSIMPEKWPFVWFETGHVGTGYVVISASASDDDIIAFLQH